MEIVIKKRVIQEGASVCREIRKLEDRFRTAMLDIAGLKRASEGEGIPGARPVRSPLHAYYPLLFRTAFPEIPQEQIRKLCRLERLYAEHLLSCDRTLDQRERFDPLRLFVAQLKQFEALNGLYGLFPPGHPFWSAFRECTLQAWRAVFHERLRHGYRLLPYPWTEFESTSTGKTALFKVFALALGYLCSRTELNESISLSLDQHHMGLLLLDDLEDWKEDYVACDFSYPLTRVILENSLEERISAGDKPALAEIGSLLYGSGIAKEQLGLAEGCFRKAMDLAKGMGLSLWIGFNREYVRRCAAMSRTVEDFGWGRRHSRTRHPSPAIETAEAPSSHEHSARCRDDGLVETRPSSEGQGEPGGHGPVRCAEPFESECAPLAEVVLHPSIPQEHREACRVALEKCREVLPSPGAFRFFLGTWPGLAAHFLSSQTGGLSIGIHLDPACVPVRSTAGRPLETEVTVAYVKAVRFVLKGPLRSELEKLFVTGMGLRICADHPAGNPLWELAGMTLLSWQWCQKNEWLLWECLDRRVRGCPGPIEPVSPASDPLSLEGCPAPRNAELYLSLRAYDDIAAKAVDTDPGNLLRMWGSEEIARGLALRPD